MSGTINRHRAKREERKKKANQFSGNYQRLFINLGTKDGFYKTVSPVYVGYE